MIILDTDGSRSPECYIGNNIYDYNINLGVVFWGRVRGNIRSKCSVRTERSPPKKCSVLFCSDRTFKNVPILFLGTFSNNKKYTGTPSPCNFYIQFILNFQGSTFCASLEIFNLKTLLTFGFSAQSLSNIAIFVLTIIYKMFRGTFQNVPMFLHFWKKMFCQNGTEHVLSEHWKNVLSEQNVPSYPEGDTYFLRHNKH